MATSAHMLAETLGDANAAQTAAGTTQADATPMIADHVSVPTVTAGQGVILRVGNSPDIRSVANGDITNNLFVYPPVGASFNGYSANAPLDLSARAAALFIFVTSNKISVIL